MKNYYIPIILFCVICVVLLIGLNLDSGRSASPLLGKPVPDFTVKAVNSAELFTSSSLKGKVYVLNFFASWCTGCHQEHKTLMDLSRESKALMFGVLYKDGVSAGQKFLSEKGNPYRFVVMDTGSDMGLDFGVTGIPETVIVDKQGVIRYKVAKPLGPDDLSKTVLPLLKKLQAE